MGYIKIIQYADTVESYTYERQVSRAPKKSLSYLQKKRIREIRKQGKFKSRTAFSVKRTRDNFFRLVHHNNFKATTVNFLTLTFAHDIQKIEANRAFARFFERLKKSVGKDIHLSYISVQEKTKANRIHLHVLLYNLPTSFSSSERETRYIQRMWGQGYADLRVARDRSPAIAGYMAKYLSKSIKSADNARGRYYNCSRNIEKVTSAGFNSFPSEVLEFHHDIVKQSSYDTIYLGRCDYLVSKRK